MKISDKNRPIKVGVYSLWMLSLFLFTFIFYIIGSNQRLFTAKRSYYLFLPNSQGLIKGAFVSLSGLKVGVVSNLELAEEQGQSGVRVEIKISTAFSSRITPASIAAIRTMGVLGDKYIDIIPGAASDSALAPGSMIPTEIPTDMGQLFGAASTALSEFQQILTNLHIITDQALAGTSMLGTLTSDRNARDNLVQLLHNLNRISSRIAAGQGTAGQLVQDPTLYTNLSRTAANLDAITTQVSQGQGTLGKMVTDTTLYGRMNGIAVRTDTLLRTLHGDGTAGRLLKDEELYTRLLSLTRSLTELTEDLKKNPKKYVSFKVF